MLRWFGILAATVLFAALSNTQIWAQAGLREALEKLDVNQDGEIEPDEVTPLARPYLERIMRARRMSPDRAYDIEKIQDAARSYYSQRNGSSGRNVRPQGESPIKEFGADRNQPLIPEFGLAEVTLPYTQDDLDFADRTMRSHDKNKDGYIDRREAARSRWTHRNPFADDLNKDERLSRLELAQRYARRRLLDDASDELRRKDWRLGKYRDDDKRERERESDRDRRRSDWRRGREYYLTLTVLGRFDDNRNGVLERDEAAKLGIPTYLIDLDRNGELSRDELHAHMMELQEEAEEYSEGLPGWFYELDANRDEQVSVAEFAVNKTADEYRQFSSMDANGDGLLTSSEVRQSKALTAGSYSNQDAEVLAPRRTVISEIEVPDDFIIGDLNVQLSITHTYASNLDAYLTGPDGQRVELFTAVGGNDDHFNQTVFDDEARSSITRARPPFEGSFVPEAKEKKQPSLSHFNGKSAKGVWQLVIRASRSERFGMLHGWSLITRPAEDVPSSANATQSQDGVEPETEDDGTNRDNGQSSD